jgi:hypothetical protein
MEVWSWVVLEVVVVVDFGSVCVGGGFGCGGRTRSPWMTTSCWITHLPARMMWRGPRTLARRLILLPVSVSMYSPRTEGLGGMMSERAKVWAERSMEGMSFELHSTTEHGVATEYVL